MMSIIMNCSIMNAAIWCLIISTIICMLVAALVAYGDINYGDSTNDFFPEFVGEIVTLLPTSLLSGLGAMLLFLLIRNYKTIINLIINLSFIGLCAIIVGAIIAFLIWIISLNRSNGSSNDEEDEYLRYQEEMAEQERKASKAEEKRRKYEDMLCYGYDGSAIVNANGKILGTTWSEDDEVTCFGTGYTIKSGNQLYTYRLNPKTLSYENVGCIKVMEK